MSVSVCFHSLLLAAHAFSFSKSVASQSFVACSLSLSLSVAPSRLPPVINKLVSFSYLASCEGPSRLFCCLHPTLTEYHQQRGHVLCTLSSFFWSFFHFPHRRHHHHLTTCVIVVIITSRLDGWLVCVCIDLHSVKSHFRHVPHALTTADHIEPDMCQHHNAVAQPHSENIRIDGYLLLFLLFFPPTRQGRSDVFKHDECGRKEDWNGFWTRLFELINQLINIEWEIDWLVSKHTLLVGLSFLIQPF